MLNPFSKQLQTNLNTGEVKEVDSIAVTTAHQYFNSINTLNSAPTVYGVFYSATPEALEAIRNV